ncbi:MAG: hypothetical protein IPP63_19125 [Chloracidobacterium sp.]|nr:hypothetical protein [Chloracidobacterium sp.]
MRSDHEHHACCRDGEDQRNWHSEGSWLAKKIFFTPVSIESAVLSVIGGVIGLVLAYIIGMVITRLVFPTKIPLWSVVVSIGVSGAVGILAGLFPLGKPPVYIRSRR